MRASRIVLVAVIGFTFKADPLFADSMLRGSKLNLSAENDDVLVIHKHDIRRRRDVEEQIETGGLAFDYDSILQIRRKSDGTEVSNQNVMPLTSLVSLENGRYFAGLSSLKTWSIEYNFILFTPDGRIITTALVTQLSDHCASLSASTTNRIRWFDQEQPVIRLIFDTGRITRVVVMNPYDQTASAGLGECVIEVPSDM